MARLESPAFSTAPPTVLHADRMPGHLFGLLSGIWNGNLYPSRVIDIFRLKNVYLAGEGLVFDTDMRLFDKTITYHTPSQIETYFDNLKVLIRDRAVTHRAEPCVLCIQPGQKNYGHWLIDLLPKAELAKDCLPGEPLVFLTPATQGPMSAVISDSLQGIDVGVAALRPSLASPEFVEDLILVESMNSHGSYMSAIALQGVEKLATKVRARNDEDIYVRRKAPAYRRFVDEDDICEKLARRGFRIVSPEEHSLAEQIAIFKGARRVLGAASAALTNICFCRPGTHVAIFYPATMADTFYWFIAQHQGLLFTDVRCRQSGSVTIGYLPWDTDMLMDHDTLEKVLADTNAPSSLD